MSHNLVLFGAGLFQTPSRVTRAALEDPTKTKDVYFAWLDETFPDDDDEDQITEHKARIEDFLREHPSAKWEST